MKTARYLSMAMLGLFVVATGARADTTTSDSTVDPYTQYDADGVPLSVTQPQTKQLSQAEINVIRKQQKQATLDKNWLLLDYEQQLKNHAAAHSSEDQNTNLYYQLSSNKELARLAGLPALDSDSQDSSTPFRTGADHSDPSSLALRADGPSAATSNSPAHGNLFKPLITPLSAPNAAGPHHFYSLPFSMASPLSGSPPQTPPAPTADQSQDSSDLETPGMVAAEKNPPTDTSTSDLTLDILPGESIEQAKAHQEDNNTLELPSLLDANQLHKEQTAALSVPGAPNAAQTVTPAPAPVKAVPIENPDDAPLPVSKTPAINPVRSPIANPYDILDR